MAQTVTGEPVPAAIVELSPVLILPCGHYVRVARPTREQQQAEEQLDRQCPTCMASVTIQAAPRGREWQIVG
jgi:hypothetical protein